MSIDGKGSDPSGRKGTQHLNFENKAWDSKIKKTKKGV